MWEFVDLALCANGHNSGRRRMHLQDLFSGHEIPALGLLSLHSICRAICSETRILTWKATGKGSTSHVDIIPKASVPHAGLFMDRHQPRSGEEKPERSVGIAKDDPWPLLAKHEEFGEFLQWCYQFFHCMPSDDGSSSAVKGHSQSVHHLTSITCRRASTDLFVSLWTPWPTVPGLQGSGTTQ